MKAFANIFGIGLVLIVAACAKNENVDPQVETVSVSATSSSTFSVQGNILETGSFSIKDYGFVYSTSNYVDTSSTKVSLGTAPVKGTFQKEIAALPNNYNYYPNNISLYVRAYLTNSKGTVYGKILSFTLPTVTVASVFPLIGKVGDQITITGNNFSSTPSSNLVVFNNTTAMVVEATPTKLVVAVPGGIDVPSYYNSYSSVNIQIRTFEGSVIATQNFTLLPTCTGFSPQSGTIGSTVTINGSGFFWGLTVTIGGVSTNLSSVSSTAITFSVPSNITSDNLSISLSLNGYPINVPGGNFIINPPVITSFSPNTGIGGTNVTILGSNFNTYGNSVTIGNTNASIQSSNTTSITFVVPTSLGLGSYSISVFTGLHTATTPDKFTLASPQITDFQPQTAARGTYVTITGSNFGSTQYGNSVLFGTTQVYIYTWTDSTIKVQVPSYMTTGTMQITINAGGQSVVSSGSIVVQ